MQELKNGMRLVSEWNAFYLGILKKKLTHGARVDFRNMHPNKRMQADRQPATPSVGH